MKVSIKTVKGDVFQVEVNESTKISFIKEKVHEKFQHEPDCQKLIHRGKHLDDNKTIAEAEIKDNDVIIMMVQKVSSPESQHQTGRPHSCSSPGPGPRSHSGPEPWCSSESRPTDSPLLDHPSPPETQPR